MSRPTFEDANCYDCSDKPNGLYAHPSDPTRFIECHNSRVMDIACPDCPSGDARCAGEQYMYFDATLGRCEWPPK